ncbi:Transcription factor tcp9 [Thalictrum thalictroides]|uniref:Transcription factor tcp9 n=1 Tax=Thalictrum thalictroides TaxID=46969 RepID=A0A7J6USH7_THATH|nr:Transcription factor tcp9 [Thalictrum thalictroides]
MDLIQKQELEEDDDGGFTDLRINGVVGNEEMFENNGSEAEGDDNLYADEQAHGMTATGTGTVPAIAMSVGGTLKIPTTPSNPETAADTTKKKRKRPVTSEFFDPNENNDGVSVSSGLAPIQAANHQIAVVATTARAVPQGLVPMWALGNGGNLISSNGAFWMIPPTATAIAGPSNQPQLWAFQPTTLTPLVNMSARPISSFVSTMQPGGVSLAPTCIEVQQPPPPLSSSITNNSATTSALGAKPAKPSTMAPSSTSVTTTTTTQLLTDFSLEIYEKQELQFMGRSAKHRQQDQPNTSSK